MVTEHYHYVEWRYWDQAKGVAGDLAAVELYDQKNDPNENANIANDPANKRLIGRLADQMKTSWPKGRVPAHAR
jgi:hypothetical protein